MRKTTQRRVMMAGAAALALGLPAARAEAAPDPDEEWSERDADRRRDGVRREGIQLEGIIGGAGCLPGRAPCSYDTQLFSGYTAPSFGTGVTLGWRAAPWLLIGGLYRLGMFNPSYDGVGAGYSVAMQHTVAGLVRPILPIWRLDLGFNIAPGYGRQAFYLGRNEDRDYTQGFSMLLGPTIDFWVLPRFFVGAEIDFIINTQRRVCRQRGQSDVCRMSPNNQVAPTHQSVFGFHLGGTFG